VTQRGEGLLVNKVLLITCIAVMLGLFACMQVQEAVLVHNTALLPTRNQVIPVVSESQSLRVMTFNIHYGEGRDGAQDLSRIAEIIKEANVDIVGLQEVDNFQPRSKFVNQAKWLADELGMYGVYGANLSVGPSQYGNAILSRFPIVSYTNMPLPSGGLEPRGCLLAEMDVNGRQLAFLSTHLGLSKDERLRQVDSILDMIREIAVPTVLVGDWNDIPDSEEVTTTTSVLSDVYVRLKRENEGATFAFGTRKPNVRIDYVFVSSDIVVLDAKTIDTQGSDHYPVVVELDIIFR
jgi:endonuclease/exonuclease/phosphatase family metal-dependent hydrolase